MAQGRSQGMIKFGNFLGGGFSGGDLRCDRGRCWRWLDVSANSSNACARADFCAMHTCTPRQCRPLIIGLWSCEIHATPTVAKALRRAGMYILRCTNNESLGKIPSCKLPAPLQSAMASPDVVGAEEVVQCLNGLIATRQIAHSTRHPSMPNTHALQTIRL